MKECEREQKKIQIKCLLDDPDMLFDENVMANVYSLISKAHKSTSHTDIMFHVDGGQSLE